MRTNTPTSNPIARDFQNVVDDAHELLKTVESEGTGKLNQARSKLQDSYDVARAKLIEAGGIVTENAKQYATRADDYVHANPWQAVGVGAAVGALVGFLLARR